MHPLDVVEKLSAKFKFCQYLYLTPPNMSIVILELLPRFIMVLPAPHSVPFQDFILFSDNLLPLDPL